MKFFPILVLALSIAGLETLYAGGTQQTTTPAPAPSGNSNSMNFSQESGNALALMDRAFERQEEVITPEDEYFLGRAVAANILNFYSPYTQNPTLTQYLNKICAVLAFHSDRAEPFNGYSVMILDSNEFNAFATSGGHIFVTRGLIEALQREDEIAAVIAHEMAHIQLRHGVSLIENMRISEDLAAIGDRANAIANQDQRVQLFTTSVREIVNTMVVNGYSQTQEFEADSLAVSLLARAGYNPLSMRDVLRILERQQLERRQDSGFSRTHPAPVLRINNVERTLMQYRLTDTRHYRQPRFSSATAR